MRIGVLISETVGCLVDLAERIDVGLVLVNKVIALRTVEVMSCLLWVVENYISELLL